MNAGADWVGGGVRDELGLVADAPAQPFLLERSQQKQTFVWITVVAQRSLMPIRSLSSLRHWLTPWAIAALAIIAFVIAAASPPRELWLKMLASAVATLIAAGSLAALLYSVAATILRWPNGSRGALMLAALSGATVPFIPIAPQVGNSVFSLVAYAMLALIAAWRLAPAEAGSGVERSRGPLLPGPQAAD